MSTGRILRIAAAVAILIGGLVHLDLYFDGYRSIPDIGRSFLLNAVVSGVVAAALAARSERFVRLAGLALAVGTIIAFVLSRQGDGLFDFREQGLNPSPQAALALFSEIAAVVLLALTFIPAVADRDASFELPVLAGTAAAAAIVMIAFGATAASSGRSSASSGSSSGATPPADTPTIVISDFSFQSPALAVTTGTTVTWINDDGVGHSVNAFNGSFGSERLDPGATFEHTFDTVGEFSYICNIHPEMAGTITVTG